MDTTLQTFDLLTPTQVGRTLKVSTDTVYKWIKRGHLPHYKLGEGKNGTVRLSPRDIKDFLDRRRIGVLDRPPVKESESAKND